MAEIRVPPNFQLMITPRTLKLQTSFWARWNCPELKFMKKVNFERKKPTLLLNFGDLLDETGFQHGMVVGI